MSLKDYQSGANSMKVQIHTDGSYDVLGASVSLTGCYPALNGRSLRCVQTVTGDQMIRYRLARGAVTLRFETDADGRLCIFSAAEDLPGIHALSPLAGAGAENTDQVFVQGFGMEGPSGVYAAGDEIPASYGLTALCAGGNTLLAYAEDHTRFRLCFEHAPDFSAAFVLEGAAGANVTLPTLFLEEAGALTPALRHCAERIAETMHARHDKPPAFFWSSWYYAYETMDQETLEETLSGIRAERVPFGYVQLDAGYTPSLGDWLTPNHRWPGGLKQAAETIIKAGLQPGIWVAPFIVGDRSKLYRDHPDWVLRDPDGRPHVQLRSYTEPKMWGNPDCDYYVLDTSHPEALEYIASVFRTLRSWGFSLFKTDFMLWSMHDTDTVLRHDPSLTSVEIMRRTLDVIRTAIGEESYLLGCIAPFMPFIGYADGMRLAGDCGAQWAEPFGPINMLREVPADHYFNHVFWQNDPDAVLLRDFATLLSPEEARSLALLQALSGGVVSTSDPIHRLGMDRKALLRLIEPKEKVTPALPFLGKGKKELVLTHQLTQGNLLYVLNPTDAPLTVFCRLSALFGDRNWYQYRYDWEEESVPSVQSELFAETLAPHASALVFVTEAPLAAKPANLWNW